MTEPPTDEQAEPLRPLTDEQWRKIVAIRPPRMPEAVARAELNFIRAEYRKFDPQTLKDERERLRRIVELASELAPALRERKALPWPEHEAVTAVLERAESILKGIDRSIRERVWQNERALLIGRLCDIWANLFVGALTATDQGEPQSGPLVRFILAATEGMFDPPINRHTIRYLVRLDREGRKYLFQERPKMAKSEWDC
jgi:hypothetical protein